MQTQPLSVAAEVTVLIPVYNGAAFLADLVAAIRAQTAIPARILFVDDRSSDGSADIIRALGYGVVLNEINLGLYASISRAISSISTAYTALIFQDDLPRADYLESLCNVARAHPAVAFLWAAIDVVSDGNTETPGLDTGRVEIIEPSVSKWRNVLRRGTFWTISGSLSRTEDLRRYGFRSDLPHCADFDFLLRAIRHATFAYLERPLMRIRLHVAQASSENLRRASDISERFAVICDHLRLYSQDASFALRWRLFLGGATTIAFRSAGAIRHRRPATAWAALGNVPALLRILRR